MSAVAAFAGNAEIILRGAPAWLPAKYRGRAQRLRIHLRPSNGLKRVLRKKALVLPSVWAPKNRVVTYGPLAGSLWDPLFLPHLAGIMDAFVFPSVKKLGNIKAPQTGSSALLETLLSYLADMNPGPAMLAYPDRETARKRSTDYLQDVFRLSPALKPLLTGLEDDLAGLRIKLKTMLIYLGWAGSVTSVGNVSVKYLFLDEVDKYPDTPSKKEASAVRLILERVRAFLYGSKVALSSTPSVPSGPINQFFTVEAQCVFDFCVPCLDCGQMQRMVFEQIKWPEGERDPQAIERGRLARYACLHCGSLWDDRARNQALEKGRWHERVTLAGGRLTMGRPLMACLEAERPEAIAFHSPAWISRLVSLSESAAAFLKGLKDLDALKYFKTQHAAEPWVLLSQVREEDRVLAYKEERPEGLVPAGGLVSCLLAGVDTQDDGFYFDIWAMGYGLELDAWQIRSGFAPTWGTLKRILFEDQYLDIDGQPYHLRLAVQDAMGHRTAEVYDFARQHPGRLVPSQGHQTKSTPFSWGKIDVYPGGNRPIPGGLQLLHLNTTYFKNQLASRFKVEPSDPGSLRFHAGVTEEYARQLCAEAPDEKGVWGLVSAGRPNHHLDSLLGVMAAAEVLGAKFWPRPAPVVVVAQPAAVVGNPFTGGRQVFGNRG